jgi:hypothetical protein
MYSSSFVQVVRELVPLVKKWLEHSDSELEGRIYFRDDQGYIQSGVPVDFFQSRFQSIQKLMKKSEKVQESVDYGFHDGIRLTYVEGKETSCLQKHLLDRIDIDVKTEKKVGFRINLKSEKKGTRPYEGETPHSIRNKVRHSYCPKGDFSYDLTIVKEEKKKVIYEIEVEVLRTSPPPDPSLLATRLVAKLLDFFHEKPSTVSLNSR